MAATDEPVQKFRGIGFQPGVLFLAAGQAGSLSPIHLEPAEIMAESNVG
jgi:hypothetical protein